MIDDDLDARSLDDVDLVAVIEPRWRALPRIAGLLGATAVMVIGGQVRLASANGAGPTTTAARPASTSTNPVPTVYVVQAGDSLAGIAKRLGVGLAALLSANHLTRSSSIQPGQRLRVPAPTTVTTTVVRKPTASTPASSPAAKVAVSATYTVIAGDTLALIAHRYGVSLGALLGLNHLQPTSLIVPGQVLHVPASPMTTTTTLRPMVTSPTTSTAATPSGAVATLVAFLDAQVGKPYAFDAAGPDSYDCSGLVMAAFARIGIALPHQSLLQSTYGAPIDWLVTPLRPGDLIFEYSAATPGVIGHVGVVVSPTEWIQAAGTGIPVEVRPIPPSSKIVAVRRLIQP